MRKLTLALIIPFAFVTGEQAAEIVAGGTAIGTLRVAEGNISAFNGVVYVQVTDIQASGKKAKVLGERSRPGSPSICRTASEPSP